ncbi:unnamed protein product [Didymodactylos carnosus]|uniref:RING-type domain-containing protein n=1 Tax=Didymodactylos carnosus TaxID=1234261 RepID=A0A813X3J4_9BILA|nr:unnamed protein product [Didymodactylos carnosus]CAF3650317.1 unnamed protein product [Didymodactylos carnosus]
MGISTESIVSYGDTPVDPVICSICHGILWKPVTCAECESTYCGECIDTWLQTANGKTCPKCGCEFKGIRVSRVLLQLLSKLQIRCGHTPNGCAEVLFYDALQNHLLECKYEVRCSKCAALYRKEQGHDRNDCLEKQMKDQNDAFQTRLTDQQVVIQNLEKQMKDQTAEFEKKLAQHQDALQELQRLGQNLQNENNKHQGKSF